MKLSTQLLCYSLMIMVLMGVLREAYANEEQPIDDYYNAAMENLLGLQQQSPDKRSCIRRGGSCDHRSNDCCINSLCRCNLWGTNCKCQRQGLFQKWGRRR